MRFVISVIDSQTRSPHTAEEIKAIDDFNDKLAAAGQRIFAGGLESPSTSFVLDNRQGKGQMISGPFVESSEYFSGFWIISADSLEEAQALAAEGSKSCNRKVELRQLIG